MPDFCSARMSSEIAGRSRSRPTRALTCASTCSALIGTGPIGATRTSRIGTAAAVAAHAQKTAAAHPRRNQRIRFMRPPRRRRAAGSKTA
jgi:hypothetical protein